MIVKGESKHRPLVVRDLAGSIMAEVEVTGCCDPDCELVGVW